MPNKISYQGIDIEIPMDSDKYPRSKEVVEYSEKIPVLKEIGWVRQITPFAFSTYSEPRFYFCIYRVPELEIGVFIDIDYRHDKTKPLIWKYKGALITDNRVREFPLWITDEKGNSEPSRDLSWEETKLWYLQYGLARYQQHLERISPKFICEFEGYIVTKKLNELSELLAKLSK